MAAEAKADRESWRKKGTEVRSMRASLKRAIADGDVDGLDVVAGLVRRWEPVAADMYLETLLLAVPGVGVKTVDELLARRKLRADMRVYGLTDALRREIADELRGVIE